MLTQIFLLYLRCSNLFKISVDLVRLRLDYDSCLFYTNESVYSLLLLTFWIFWGRFLRYESVGWVTLVVLIYIFPRFGVGVSTVGSESTLSPQLNVALLHETLSI